LHNNECSLLEVKDLVTGFGKKQVLSGITLKVNSAEVVALIGHNGAGKSTLLKAIFGLIPVWQGQVFLKGKTLTKLNPLELLHHGVVYVPQGNRVFPNLTVRENLEARGEVLYSGAKLNERIDNIFTLFPDLKARIHQRAGTLSGGEKQMLALAGALILSPRLLLLDEPSLGVAPSMVSKVLNNLQQISHDSGAAILIIEQRVREILRIASRVYILRNGLVSFSGSADELSDDEKLRSFFL
jgi:branched-chain amino acid transport system ATP-binding protein